MIRWIIAVVLIGVGVFGLVLAVLFPTVVVSGSKKTPLDLDITIRSTGKAQLLNAATGKTDTVDLRATRIVRTDSKSSNSKYTTVNESLCIVVVADPTTPDCLRAVTPAPTTGSRLLSYTTDRVTTDRKTAESVNKPEWGGNVNGDTNVQREGMAYKWPIDSQKRDYRFFAPDLKRAFDARFVGTSRIGGLTVYQYISETGDQPYKVQGLLPGTYNDVRTVYVEPRTGAIIRGIEHQVQKLQNGTTALDTTLEFDQKSIDSQVKYAKDKIDQLRVAQLWAPLACGIIGALALAGGILLAVRANRKPPGGAGQPAHAEPSGGGGGSPDVDDTLPLMRP